MIEIRAATAEDCAILYKLNGKEAAGYFEDIFTRDCTVFIAARDGADCGYCIYNRAPRYSLYKRLGIPEIQDLNVMPAHRRYGAAKALIEVCENMARDEGREAVGISVGLFKDYGPAQILYAKMGYIPDGHGITHDRTGVTPYASYVVDDDLCLMMVKAL